MAKTTTTSRKTRTLWLFSILILLIACACVAVTVVNEKRERQLETTLAKRLAEVEIAVNKHTNAHQSNPDDWSCIREFPVSLAEVLGTEFLPEMPINPYTGEPMPVLAPGDPAVPGGVVYYAWYYKHPDDKADDYYVDSYLILVYGHKTRKVKPGMTEEPGAYCWFYEMPDVVAATDQIDWSHVAWFEDNHSRLCCDR